MTHLNTLVTRVEQNCSTMLEDEMVILNASDDKFYHFNATAVDLWASLKTPKKIMDLTQILVEKYAGTYELYQEDVIQWVEDAKQNGLLTLQF